MQFTKQEDWRRSRAALLKSSALFHFQYVHSSLICRLSARSFLLLFFFLSAGRIRAGLFPDNSSARVKSSVSFRPCPRRIMPRRREMFVFIRKESELNSLTRLFALRRIYRRRYTLFLLFFFLFFARSFPFFLFMAGMKWEERTRGRNAVCTYLVTRTCITARHR